jgi:hypothetical protein
MNAIADLTSLRDREWFEAHPGVTRYLRPAVPGEWPAGIDRGFDAVLVTLLAEDVRAREPLYLGCDMTPAETAEALEAAIWCEHCATHGGVR